MTLRDSWLAALVALIWGINFLVIDWGLTGMPPLLMVALRFAVVAVPAVFLVPRPAAPWRAVVAVGVFMSLGQFTLLYLGLQAGMPPGLAALLLQAQVVLTVVIAAGVLRERSRPAQVVGVVLGSAGLAVVATGRDAQVPLVALVLVLGAALSWAIGNVVARASGVPSGLGLTVWSALVVPVPVLALSLVVDGPAVVGAALVGISWQAVVSTLYTAGLASLVGYALFTTLLGRYSSATVVPWVLLVPVVAITAAWLVLGQRPNAAEAGGGLLLVLGALVATRPGRRRRPARPGTPTGARGRCLGSGGVEVEGGAGPSQDAGAVEGR